MSDERGTGALPEDTRITLRYPDGTVANMRVSSRDYEPDEATSNYARLSPESSLGRALLGCRVGDNISYDTPAGQAYAQVQDIQFPT